MNNEYSRCIKCGLRRPKSKLTQYKLQNYCSDNSTKDKPSCYMSEFLKDLEILNSTKTGIKK